jgi:hypothetical protein
VCDIASQPRSLRLRRSAHRTPGARATKRHRELFTPCRSHRVVRCVSRVPDPTIISLCCNLCSLPCIFAPMQRSTARHPQDQIHRTPHITFFPFLSQRSRTPHQHLKQLVSLSNKQGTQQRPRAPPHLPFRTTACDTRVLAIHP